MTARPFRGTLIPEDASIGHGHWLCRLLHHGGLSHEQDVDRPSPNVIRLRIVRATCTDCGREQPRVIVRWPRSYSIPVANLHAEDTPEG